MVSPPRRRYRWGSGAERKAKRLAGPVKIIRTAQTPTTEQDRRLTEG